MIGSALHYPRGLTLVEMLVVLALLAAVSGMVVSLTNNLESRSRYDQTCERLVEIRTAILGPDAVSADGHLLSGGYLQDVGALPAGGRDLLYPPEALKTWMEGHGTGDVLQYDPEWRTWFGWRGPYLAAPSRRGADTENSLYDGWGEDFLWPTGAWGVFPLPSGSDFAIRSKGADCTEGGTGFDGDLPHPEQPLIGNADWESPELSGQLQVTIVNQLTDKDFSETSARLRVVWPDFSRAAGPFSCADYATDPTVCTFDLSVMRVPGSDDPPEQNRQTCAFVSNAGSLKAPLGRRMIFLLRADGSSLTDSEGRDVDACAQLALSKRLMIPDVTIYIRRK